MTRIQHARAPRGGAEYRDLGLDTAFLEVRRQGGERRVSGYAAVFDVRTTLFPGYDEIIRPGAFSKTLRESDVVGLFNHDPSLLLGRKSAGTLDVNEDDRGLFYRIPVDEEDEVSRRVARKTERREIKASSFAFRAVKAPEMVEDDGTVVREVLEARLFDVSPVTYPAYDASTAQLRSMLGGGTIDTAESLVAALGDGLGLSRGGIVSMLRGAMEIANRASVPNGIPLATLEREVAQLERG